MGNEQSGNSNDLQISQCMKISLTLEQAEKIAESTQILTVLETADSGKYKDIHTLMKYNALGSLKLMVARGALQGGQMSKKFNLHPSESGLSGPSAWSKYKTYLIEFLAAINPSVHLRATREQLADKIWKQYYTFAPSWPSNTGDESNMFSMKLNEKETIDNENFIYVYAVTGIIYMQDKKLGYCHYQAKIWTQYDESVNFRCLKMVKRKLVEIMADIEKYGIETVKKAVDSAADMPISKLALQYNSQNSDDR